MYRTIRQGSLMQVVRAPHGNRGNPGAAGVAAEAVWGKHRDRVGSPSGSFSRAPSEYGRQENDLIFEYLAFFFVGSKMDHVSIEFDEAA